MPVYFWDDPNNEKYKNAYFSEYGGILLLTVIL
jgi:hypothetical protein